MTVKKDDITSAMATCRETYFYAVIDSIESDKGELDDAEKDTVFKSLEVSFEKSHGNFKMVST